MRARGSEQSSVGDDFRPRRYGPEGPAQQAGRMPFGREATDGEEAKDRKEGTTEGIEEQRAVYPTRRQYLRPVSALAL